MNSIFSYVNIVGKESNIQAKIKGLRAKADVFPILKVINILSEKDRARIGTLLSIVESLSTNLPKEPKPEVKGEPFLGGILARRIYNN